MNELNALGSSEKAPPEALLWRRRHAFALSVIGLALVQVALVLYYERPSIIFSREPHSWLDYDTHIEQVKRAVEALDRFGKSWAYDPSLLAGNPHGTIFEADNKGWELWTFALHKLGVPQGLAFNLFILLAHLLVPWVVLWSARLFGLGRFAALGAAAMGLFLWYFDAFPHWCFWCGMIAYAIVGYLCLLPLGLFYRFLRDGRWRHLVLLGLVLGLAHLIHPYAFVILALPMAALYAAAFRRLSPARHAGILAAAAAAIAMNLYWLVPSLRFWHYILMCETGVYAQSDPSFLLPDYLGLLKEPMSTGYVVTRSGLRFIAMAAAAVCLVEWRRARDDRFWPLLAAAGGMLALTYLGGASSLFTHIQPYRHVLPAMYFSLIPAAALAERIAKSGDLLGLPRLAYAVGGLGILVVFGNLSRDVLYFAPELLPKTRLAPEDALLLEQANPDVPHVTSHQMALRHGPTFPDMLAVTRAVNRHHDGKGRILVEDWILGEHLAWSTRAEILGGFRLRNIQHSKANLFRRYDEGRVSEEDVRRFLVDYAVEWVIVSGPRHELERYRDLLRPLGVIPPSHRVYESTQPVSLFAKNRGEVRASLNRIEVQGTDPKRDVVLRYHWMETLACEPGCAVRRDPVAGDPVGFIRVPAPHPVDFTILNAY